MTDLRQVTEADVYLGDQLVGTLVREPDDQVSFDYLGTCDPAGGAVRDRSVSWSLRSLSCGGGPGGGGRPGPFLRWSSSPCSLSTRSATPLGLCRRW